MIPLLSSLLGGGGSGLSNNSSVAQSTPFYNESGIYFNSPGAGTIQAGDAVADTTSGPPKSSQNIAQAMPDSSLGYSFSPPTSSNLLYYVLGGLALIAVGAFVLFKK